MPVYEYTALNDKGKKLKGIIDAQSTAAARAEAAREQHLPDRSAGDLRGEEGQPPETAPGGPVPESGVPRGDGHDEAAGHPARGRTAPGPVARNPDCADLSPPAQDDPRPGQGGGQRGQQLLAHHDPLPAGLSGFLPEHGPGGGGIGHSAPRSRTARRFQREAAGPERPCPGGACLPALHVSDRKCRAVLPGHLRRSQRDEDFRRDAPDPAAHHDPAHRREPLPGNLLVGHRRGADRRIRGPEVLPVENTERPNPAGPDPARHSRSSAR